jgi:GT2 family glycosyltransferase
MLVFAIVIPNLNQSHFISTALESLRYQSSPFNLALMDGGSTDNFRTVIEPYTDIITVLRSQPDAGQAAAIREGKNQIGGDIVAWLNADDYYFPNVLDKVASCFEQDPHVDVIYGDAVHVSPEGFFLSYFPPIQEFNARDLTRTCFICQPACFVRRSAFERVGGINPTLEYTMDWDLWCRLALAGAKFQYIHDVLAAVRYYPKTKTSRGGKRRYKEIYRIERKYGKRVFPVSCLGSYYYGLTHKAKKNIPQRVCFKFLAILRSLKKSVSKVGSSKPTTPDTNYGFHRWNPIVEGVCAIHLPWYDKQLWKRMYLEVEPHGQIYSITINNSDSYVVTAIEGRIALDIPSLEQPHRIISIECPRVQRWKLLRFYCDLA